MPTERAKAACLLRSSPNPRARKANSFLARGSTRQPVSDSESDCLFVGRKFLLDNPN